MGSEMCIRDSSYSGDRDDLRRARLVRERQSRETADRMERTQSTDVDASSWADEHRRQIRGHHGHRDAETTSQPAEETTQKPTQKSKAAEPEPYSDWLEETESEQKPTQPPQIKRRAHGHDLGPLYDSARGNRGQLGRRNSRGSRYQHVGQRVPKRERFPPNSLHRLLPAEWGQGKRTRAINR